MRFGPMRGACVVWIDDAKAIGSTPDIPNKKRKGREDKPTDNHRKSAKQSGKQPKSFNPNFSGNRRRKQK